MKGLEEWEIDRIDDAYSYAFLVGWHRAKVLSAFSIMRESRNADSEGQRGYPVGKIGLREIMRGFSKEHFGGAKLPLSIRSALTEGMAQGAVYGFKESGYKVIREKVRQG